MTLENTADNSANLVGENINLASWNIPRSVEQLRAFVSSREENLALEDFDFI